MSTLDKSTPGGSAHTETLKKTHTKLKHNALNFWEVSAHAVALISPSMTAALIVPLMFATAGTAGWLCYLFGTVMLLFVALNLNQFARRRTSAGSMYEYTVQGLGPKLGGISGWSLIFAYLFIGIAGVTGFTHFASMLLTQAGATGYLSHPWITLFLICVTCCWFLAYKDITLSALMMLAMEGVSVLVITILGVYALCKTGFWDSTQVFCFKGMTFHDSMAALGLGVVVAIFSGVGFECATAFGEEAKKPLVTIPRAVIASLLLTGTFFIFVTYTETHALANNNPTLDQLTAPLTTLSENLGMKWMGIVIECGAMVSFFALALSCMNSGSRIIFSMGRYGIFPVSIGSSHKHNLTPHMAITSFAIVQFLIPTIFMLAVYAGATNALAIGVPLDEFNDAGLFGAMGFCGAYVLISLATPFYLKKIGEAKAYHWFLSGMALLLLIVPIVGTVYPAPSYPCNYFAYIYGAYLVGGIILVLMRSRNMSEMTQIRKVLDETAAMPAMSSGAKQSDDSSDEMPHAAMA
ncbi:MAG TPA: APC family permease [Tepidisphaeraceae bacterium]|nr:APC family permease [Tepidisphaeraceae bacterium]